MESHIKRKLTASCGMDNVNCERYDENIIEKKEIEIDVKSGEG